MPARKLTNMQIMEKRGKNSYNPGGHRGRSGENGAGNYRKTAEERAFTARITAETEARKAKKNRVLRTRAQFERNYKKITDKMAAMNVRPLGTAFRVMDQHNWNQVSLRLSCRICRNPFNMMPEAILKTKSKHLCPACYRSSCGKPKSSARVKFEMRCDEQGLELVKFSTTGEKCDVKDRLTETVHSIWPQNIERWGCISPEDHIIRFVADDDDYVFVFRGQPPLVKHPYIKHMLDTYPIETLKAGDKPVKSVSAMAAFIKQCHLEGDRVVNMSLNKEWLGEAKYTWGKIPDVDKYLEELRAKWRECSA